MELYTRRRTGLLRATAYSWRREGGSIHRGRREHHTRCSLRPRPLHVGSLAAGIRYRSRCWSFAAPANGTAACETGPGSAGCPVGAGPDSPTGP
jgi:hypothetical protein